MQEWEESIAKGQEENLKGDEYTYELDCEGNFISVNIGQNLLNFML